MGVDDVVFVGEVDVFCLHVGIVSECRCLLRRSGRMGGVRALASTSKAATVSLIWSEAALQNGKGFQSERVLCAMPFVGADGIEHATQRIIDFVGNAGSQSADCGKPVRGDDLVL